MKRVLVACEESQEVCKAFRERGFEAYSCDIIECSGGHPEWHIQDDVLDYLDGQLIFYTSDGVKHYVSSWDLIIAHPPCTYLCVSGNRWFNVEKYGQAAIDRQKKRADAVDFFMEFVNADCPHIAIENPIGIISTVYRKPDQIIQPWMFGDNFTKSTCLWLNGLPYLKADVIEKPSLEYFEWTDKKTGKVKRQNMWYKEAWSLPPTERAKLRSKTFPGIAKAMAEQWGEYILEEDKK